MSTLGPVRQLIYTNVKPELSPTGQGGFQVWRYSTSLEPEHRKLVAKRLGDFKLPPELSGLRPPKPAPGAPPESLENSPLKAAVRHQAYPVAGVGYVVARAVPIAERDEFGRGGRFFAHALILDDDQFAAIDFDPFRVFGANPFPKAGDGFEFWGDVSKELLGPGGGKPDAFLPDATVAPVAPPDADELPPKYRTELLGYLTRAVLAKDEHPGAAPKPVVWPARPEDVFGVARNVVRALPPSARQQFSFDTMTNGAGLDKEPYPLVGGYSAGAVRMWSSRKYHAFEPAAETFRPPLPKADALPGKLFAAPGWGALSDADKDAAYKTADALAQKNTDLLKAAPKLSDAATDVLRVHGRPAADELLKEKIEKELPPTLAALPAVREKLDAYAKYGFRMLLHLLPLPLDRVLVGHGLRAALLTPERPADPVLADLAKWLDQAPAPADLYAVLARWRLDEEDTKWLEGELPRADAATQSWAKSTLGVGKDDAVTGTSVNGVVRIPFLREIRVWLALNQNYADRDWVWATLQVAFHTEPKALDLTFDYLYARPESRPHVEDWQVEVLAKVGCHEARPVWMLSGARRLLGLGTRLPPQFLTRFQLLHTKGSGDLVRRVVRMWRENHDVVPQYPEPQPRTAPYPAVRECLEEILKHELSESELAKREDRLLAALRYAMEQRGNCDDYDFLLWSLRDKARGKVDSVEFEGDPAAFFLGVKVDSRTTTYQKGYLHLFAALARRTGVATSTDEGLPPATAQEAKLRKYMFWSLYDALTAP